MGQDRLLRLMVQRARGHPVAPLLVAARGGRGRCAGPSRVGPSGEGANPAPSFIGTGCWPESDGQYTKHGAHSYLLKVNLTANLVQEHV